MTETTAGKRSGFFFFFLVVKGSMLLIEYFSSYIVTLPGFDVFSEMTILTLILLMNDCLFIHLNLKHHFCCCFPLFDLLHCVLLFTECCQHASKWRVSEGFSQRPGQQGLHQVLCTTEAPKSGGGKAKQHVQRIHQTAGKRYRGREMTFTCPQSVHAYCSCIFQLEST